MLELLASFNQDWTPVVWLLGGFIGLAIGLAGLVVGSIGASKNQTRGTAASSAMLHLVLHLPGTFLLGSGSLIVVLDMVERGPIGIWKSKYAGLASILLGVLLLLVLGRINGIESSDRRPGS